MEINDEYEDSHSENLDDINPIATGDISTMASIGSDGESYNSVDWEDAESGDTDSDELPDLLPETTEAEQRECWICFLRESENPTARWVSPCRCTGSLGHVHQDCVKRWVEEKQNGNFNIDVICPQCETKYRFVFPDKNNLLRILNFSDMLIKNGVQVLVIGAVLGSAYMVCTIYTRHVFKAMIEENYKFDGECLSLQPYHGQILKIIEQSKLQFRQFTSVLIGVRLPLYGEHTAIWLSRNRELNPVLRVVASIAVKASRVLTSIAVPIQLVQLRRKKWDEWILKKIDEYQNVETRYNSVVGTQKPRTYIGGLLMPFISRFVGDRLFPEEPALKRFIYGNITYLSVKGIITLVRKYKFRKWLRARELKNFEVNDENAGNGNRTTVQVELNGENWIDFNW